MIKLTLDALGLGPAAARRHYGLLAEFASPAAIHDACERVRDAGYTRWDAHTPFPVHGLEKAMGLKDSRVPWVSLALGLFGAAFAFLMQWWLHGWLHGENLRLGLSSWSVQNYPLVISGKPYFAWPTYIPITFELGVLFGAIGAVVGMLALNQLPRLHHSLFSSERFERVTDDKFFIAVEAIDPKFDEEATAELLRSLGADHVELVER